MSRAHRPTVRRCAVYTRKSSDEGLEQSFNSLDAQREACEAYIASQRHEGWVLVHKPYDDGGLSGGSMNRPALQELLADIGAGHVDVVVVYKVDRLTRSLADFAKLTDLLDACDASFVSVTQAFNTSTSMGRLTLNVLLSFAQFEREVAGERIRDKIAASKKRGMWMGGLPPLGYDIQDKQLVVNEAEAITVRRVFESYIKFGTVAKLKAAMDATGVVTKQRITRCKTNGIETGTVRELGGKPISRSGYHAILKCHTYRGKIHHKGQVYDGNHKAIISEDFWEAAQVQLAANTADHGLSRIGQKGERVREVRKLTGNHMLTGILFDTKGERLSPSHATKRTKDGGTRRYFYYVVASLVRGQATSKGVRVSASDLDNLVVTALKGHLTNQDWLAGQLKESQYTGDHGDTRNQDSGGQHENDRRSSDRGGSNQGDRDQNHAGHEQELRKPPTGVQQLHRVFEAGQALASAITQKTTRTLLERVVVGQGSITISIHGRALHEALQLDADCHLPDTISITQTTKVIRDGKGTRLIFGQVNIQEPHLDQDLINQLKMAHHWADALFSGKHPSIAALARAERVDPSEVSRTITLAFLAPSITRTILKGTQPPSLTLDALRRARPLPPSWNEQEAMLQA